jgi:hypothetical protein
LLSQDKPSNYPLTLEIEKSVKLDLSEGNADAARQADEMGAPAPVSISFWGTLNGESHWVFECEAENVHNEVNPCTELPKGKYIARWMHNRQMLQVVFDGPDGISARYLTVSPNPKDPPQPGDPVVALGSYDFPIAKPANQRNTDYPLLVHVYGASRMRISKGYVLLDAKVEGRDPGMVWCDAKTRLGICFALSPGFYAARWLDDGKTQIVLLRATQGDTHEYGFAVKKQ